MYIVEIIYFSSLGMVVPIWSHNKFWLRPSRDFGFDFDHLTSQLYKCKKGQGWEYHRSGIRHSLPFLLFPLSLSCFPFSRTGIPHSGSSNKIYCPHQFSECSRNLQWQHWKLFTSAFWSDNVLIVRWHCCLVVRQLSTYHSGIRLPRDHAVGFSTHDICS